MLSGNVRTMYLLSYTMCIVLSVYLYNACILLRLDILGCPNSLHRMKEDDFQKVPHLKREVLEEPSQEWEAKQNLPELRSLFDHDRRRSLPLGRTFVRMPSFRRIAASTLRVGRRSITPLHRDLSTIQSTSDFT
ncbi:hypothetical protein RIF29_34755 [Crotalaria pallida]|uniref:Uncharacterized protein n=1 Tax=Crotalaria pallida TaxID=3830 RepID=A0AAN9E968_CROPI